MRNFLLIFSLFILVSCSLKKDSITGTFISRGSNEVCNQVILFDDFTYEYVTCGEIVTSFDGQWKQTGDTIEFSGFRIPFEHSKYLIQKKKLYKIANKARVEGHWTLKRKSRRNKPFVDYH